MLLKVQTWLSSAADPGGVSELPLILISIMHPEVYYKRSTLIIHFGVHKQTQTTSMHLNTKKNEEANELETINCHQHDQLAYSLE